MGESCRGPEGSLPEIQIGSNALRRELQAGDSQTVLKKRKPITHGIFNDLLCMDTVRLCKVFVFFIYLILYFASWNWL